MNKETQTLYGLLLSSLIINLAFGAIIPFLSLYSDYVLYPLNLKFIIIGVTTQIGLLTSAMMISRAFLAPFYGELSDRAGRKSIMVVGFAMYTILTFAFGLATSFWSLFLIRFFQGIASALVWPVAESAVVDISSPEKRGRNIGWFMMSMTLGWSIGPFVGAGLLAIIELFISNPIQQFQLTFIFMGVINLFSLVVFNILVVDPQTKKAKMSIKEIALAIKTVFLATVSIKLKIPSFLRPSFWRRRSTSLKAIFVMAFSNGFGFSMIFPIMSLFLVQYYFVDDKFVGVIFGIAGILGVIFNPLGGYIADRWNKKLLVVITALISGLFISILGIRMSLYLLLSIFIIRQVIQQISMPAFRALQADLVSSEVRGLEFGNVQMFYNLAAVLGPIVGGVLYDLLKPFSWSIGKTTIFGIEILFLITFALTVFSVIVITIFVSPSDYIIPKFTPSPSALAASTATLGEIEKID
ncbi:MAG: MFS transporter [Candidatus Heimdallarchaeaceae archaeon]